MKNRILLILMLLSGFQALAQDLETAWLNYSETSARYDQIILTYRDLLSQQDALRAEMDRLQNSTTWYNAWLNKLLLSSNSQKQLDLIATQDELEAQRSQLEQQQQRELDELKAVYTELVQTYEKTGTIAVEQKPTARRVGRILLEEKPEQLQLPDYSNLLSSEYSSPALRKLVLEDLKRLLTSKLLGMKTLLEQQQSEAELSQRLSAFHADLGLQLEAGQDIQERDAAGEPLAGAGWESRNAEMLDASAGIQDNYTQTKSAESGMMRTGRETLESTATSLGSESEPQYLLNKQLEYEALLIQVEAELTSAP